jgi:large subunit ribosomal protein L10
MSRLLKAMMRTDIESRLNGVDGGVFVSTQGLNSELTYDFRVALNARNLRYMVLRNALARQALEAQGFDQAELKKIFTGNMGVVFGAEEGSACAAARAIDEWKTEKRDKVIEWKGAFMEGDLLGPKDAKSLKDAPTKDQARAMLLGIIQAPVTQFLATIREPFARIVYVLNNYHKKREEEGK